MSNDGSNKVNAEVAMKAILGSHDGDMVDAINEAPEPAPEEFREEIFGGRDSTTYEGTANVIAAALIKVMDKHPEMVDWPGEDEHYWVHDDDRECDSPWGCGRPYEDHEFLGRGLDNLTDAYRELASTSELDALGAATGFMWGWAVNAAKFVHSAPPVPNPAILTIGGSDE